MNRRKFILNSILSFLIFNSCKKQSDHVNSLVVGKISDFMEGDNHLDLYRLVLKKKVVGNKIMLKAMSKLCTHQTCLINNEYECPCHGSKFSNTGEVMQGPAIKNLPYFMLSMDKNQQVNVHFSKIVDSNWKLEI